MNIDNLKEDKKLYATINMLVAISFNLLCDGKMNKSKQNSFKDGSVCANMTKHFLDDANKHSDGYYIKNIPFNQEEKIKSYFKVIHFMVEDLKDKNIIHVFKPKIELLDENLFIVKLSIDKKLSNGVFMDLFGKELGIDYDVTPMEITEMVKPMPSGTKIKIIRKPKYTFI